jgi:hypothetical protein
MVNVFIAGSKNMLVLANRNFLSSCVLCGNTCLAFQSQGFNKTLAKYYGFVLPSDVLHSNFMLHGWLNTILVMICMTWIVASLLQVIDTIFLLIIYCFIHGSFSVISSNQNCLVMMDLLLTYIARKNNRTKLLPGAN